MTKLLLRPVGDDGLLGAPVATITRIGNKITYDGAGDSMADELLAGMARRFKTDEAGAFALVAKDGWSNGKLTLTADAEVEGGQEEGAVGAGARVDLTRLHNLAESARQMRLKMLASLGVVEEREPRVEGKSWYRIEQQSEAQALLAGLHEGATSIETTASVYLFDAIGEWGITAQDFVNDLNGVKAKSIELHVNCEGGEVFDGVAIYETLLRHPANITAYVDGIAASSASFVVQAADRIVIGQRARMMIHNAHGAVFGNAKDMREMADLLESLSDTIADIYAERSQTGTRASWRAAMEAASGGPDGSWYDATAAVKAGLADELADAGGKAAGGRVRAELVSGVPRDEALAIGGWDPAAFLDLVRETDNPAPPVRIPDGQALLNGLKVT